MSLYRQQIPYDIAVALGMVDGVNNVGKFGYNGLITSASDPEDLWEGGGEYTFSADGANDIVSLASTSAADTGQIIMVEGNDADGINVTQMVATNGTNRVALGTPLNRCYRLSNLSDQSASGTIKVYTGTGGVPPVGSSLVRAIIDNGNNQTQMAIYSVPAGKVAVVKQGEVGMEFEPGGFFSADAGSRLSFRIKQLGRTQRIQKTIALLSTGNSNYSIDVVAGAIPARSDFWIRIDEVTEDMGINGAFEVFLYDERLISPEKLAEIGQPGY